MTENIVILTLRNGQLLFTLLFIIPIDMKYPKLNDANRTCFLELTTDRYIIL